MKNHIKSLNSIRTLSILAVLLIHTTTRTLEAGSFNLTQFPFSILANQISRFAVPLFFIISGFLLEHNADEKLNYKKYFKKRLIKIALPYVFWSTIYYYFVFNNNHDNMTKVLLNGNASYHLYFIPTICIFYLIFPLLHNIYKVIINKWVIILLFVAEYSLLYQDYFITLSKTDNPIRITSLSFFFFIIGMWASHNKNRLLIFCSKWKRAIFPLTVLFGIFIFIEGQSRYLSSGNYNFFYSQWRPSVLIYSLIVGLFTFFLFEKTKIYLPKSEMLSKLSYFVFFIHVIVLEYTWTIFGYYLFELISGSIIGKVIFDLIFFGNVTLISYFIAYLIHKFPKLSKITG